MSTVDDEICDGCEMPVDDCHCNTCDEEEEDE